ncbi:exo-alpha-sialidase [Mariniradius sediminis]|uniref:Exo-alpha-sialidase n=1 Tax=Mariniradius sediminis TaxID=2909237 RepID=A0ABS9BN45_9BACT|nr:exo-alpha-sialidase [Mariniradius sediminis]MCF1749478.1 exo-alpha-sialidase [Mariniradius sediminis]
MKTKGKRQFTFQVFCVLVSCTMLSCKERVKKNLPSLSEPREIVALGKHIEEPYLFTSPSGEVFLSWIEKSDSLSTLFYAKWEENNWTGPQLIASGKDWFVNWADYPQMEMLSDGTLVAVFLQKSGPGTFSYDVMLTFSKDGREWTEPTVLHDDGTLTEHGFVSMIPWENDLLIAWLDGRNTGGTDHTADTHDHGHHGQMTLRAARLDSNGNKLAEWELDDRVCDCCQTSVAMGSEGPMVIFRDRSESEVRDIGIVRWTGEAWTQTMPVHADFWEIAACPVNGPRIDSRSGLTAVAWYTGAQDKPRVQLVFSNNGGKDFGKPIPVDLGKTIGRVAIALDDKGKAWVAWMEEGAIYLRWVGQDGKKGDPMLVSVSSGKRGSGFPQLTAMAEGLMLAWTDDGEWRKIKSKSVAWD